MIRWQITKLGDVIDTLKGAAFKSSLYAKAGIPIVRISNFTDDSIASDEIFYYAEVDAVNYSKYQLNHWDILIQTVGSWQHNPASIVGKVVKVPKELDNSLLNQNIVKLIPSLQIENKFLYYRLKDESFKAYIISCAQGAANQASITLESIKKFNFHLPSFPTQKRIAAILSAYDDLIENNLKRIKLLEEIAQRTYEEWFLKFRVNGVQLPIDENTELPVGWVEGIFSDIISFQSGFAFKTSKFKKEGFPVIKIKNIENNTVDTTNTDFIDGEYAELTKKAKLDEGDLLIAMTGATVGKVGFLPFSNIPCYLNQRVGRFLNKGETKNIYFIFATMTQGSGLQQVLNLAGGAAQPNISGDQIMSIKSIIPSENILTNFSELAESLFDQILILRHQNQKLKQSRDILLPRLMSGTINLES
jgi:type I restriction enzyme S subunit